MKYTNEILFEMNLVRMDAEKGRKDIGKIWKSRLTVLAHDMTFQGDSSSQEIYRA